MTVTKGHNSAAPQAFDLQGQMTNYRYQAPEILSANTKESKTSFDQKVDIWAVGVITYLFLTGAHPFDISSKEAFTESILQQSQNLTGLSDDDFA